MNDKPSRMDYRQHQAARRLVHEGIGNALDAHARLPVV